MARSKRRDWIRYQGRANAALMLLARDMGAEFIEPADEKEFAGVRGRAQGCTFELRVAGAVPGGEPALALDLRQFSSHGTQSLGGDGCALPSLDPEALRAAIEDECRRFTASAE